MNKVVAVLGIIVLLTLAMLFFCIGFFTGSTATPGSLAGNVISQTSTDLNDNMSKEAIAQKLGDIGDIKSAKISDKVMRILAAAGYKIENFSEIIKTKASKTLSNKTNKGLENEPLSTDALLREIASSHSPQDDCSYQKTITEIQEHESVVDKTLDGKKIVFIGYFKNAIAVQIQKLLTGRGYKTHVELSKSSNGQESFVFCGPFKKDETANKLLQWLQTHDFTEARIISITKEAIEETLYDAINDVTGLPENDENIPPAATMSNMAGTSTTTTGIPIATAVTPVISSVSAQNSATTTPNINPANNNNNTEIQISDPNETEEQEE
ncbi:MAG: hypothetical protein IJT36_09690 [Alphaproteobacteria bacterium]|nr:hypothetical protein [Alphaproteobacteria bacterium]